MKRILLAICLVIPIAGLGWMVYGYQIILSKGKTVTFPIRGSDPRDLLAGHYLTLAIDYGVPRPECPDKTPICFCIEDEKPVPPRGSFMDCNDVSNLCVSHIKGTCNYGSFNANLDRYYLNEKKALTAPRANRTDRVVVAISKDGTALIKDFIWGESNQAR